jgi:ubiquinone biosynthesis protein COQ4
MRPASAAITPVSPRKWVGLSDIKRALRALAGVSKTPNRTDLVGVFIGSLTGPSAHTLFVRVWRDPIGRALLEEGRDLGRTLSDRSYLSSLPQGTFGRAYYDWTAERNYTAEGIADAIRSQVPRDFGGPRPTMAARVVDMHDLWHLLNGWDSDILGEVHLLGYSHAQLGAYVWLLLGLLANIPLVLGGRFDGLTYLRNAIRRGKKATLLAAVDWEAMLPLRLEDVRQRLGIDEPIPYRKLSFEELAELRRTAPVHRFLAALFGSLRSRPRP